jgi:hypothetical protein
MEILIVGGVIAVILLVALAAFYLLQQRRAGTVKAVVGPRAGAAATEDRDTEPDEAETAR